MTTKFLTQLATGLIGIFVFFNIFPHTTAIKQISFYLCVFIVLLLITFKKRDFTFKTPLALPFVVFILWSGLSIFWAMDKGESIHEFYACLLRYLALYYILINFFNSKRQFILLTWIIIISASVFSVSGLICFAHGNNIIESRFGFQESTSMCNRIGYTTLPAILLLAFHLFRGDLKPYCKAILFFSLSGTFMATLLTYSRGTYLAVIASFIVMLWNNKKRLFAFFLLIIICIGGLYTNSAIFRSRINYNTLLNKNERLHIWYTALEMIKDRPVAGFGLGNVFKENWMAYNARLPACDQFKAHSFTHPHNFLLDITTRLGLIGISLFLYIVFMLVKMCLQIIKNGKDEFIRGWGLCIMSAFVGIFVVGFFDKIFSDMPLCVISTLFAMITILWNLNKGLE